MPCLHARTQADARTTRNTFKLFQRRQRIASHAQCASKCFLRRRPVRVGYAGLLYLTSTSLPLDVSIGLT
ncbi:hypothetical protein [Massilia sp. TWR1-2-2]|uniref:hypothetical protein n=1 Tax=Massilia sp. TWR1-2-2 TaxID=2804584 RepID=UPI003CEEF05B